MTALPRAGLTLGPLLFHWSAARRRDFYLRIADEAPVDGVYLGEVVCSKRESTFAAHSDEVIRRLESAGKTVIRSTLALVTSAREIAAVRAAAAQGVLVEANDVACLDALGGAPHIVGPYINVVNEGTRDFLATRGAVRIVLPVELTARSIGILAASAGDTQIEVHAFGRQPLSVAMRCYHARSHQLSKDHCQLVCALDPDGLAAATLDGEEILAVNGTQTLSHGYAVVLEDLAGLQAAGVGHFRLSPHSIDMVRVARLYRDLLDLRVESAEVAAALQTMVGRPPLIDGFLRGRAGLSRSASAAPP